MSFLTPLAVTLELALCADKNALIPLLNIIEGEVKKPDNRTAFMRRELIVLHSNFP